MELSSRLSPCCKSETKAIRVRAVASYNRPSGFPRIHARPCETIRNCCYRRRRAATRSRARNEIAMLRPEAESLGRVNLYVRAAVRRRQSCPASMIMKASLVNYYAGNYYRVRAYEHRPRTGANGRTEAPRYGNVI